MRIPALTLFLLGTLCSTSLGDDQQKRAPLGFTGVRGKKSIPDSAYSQDPGDPTLIASDTLLEAVKRAPSGFMGMRGKKPYTFPQPWEGTYPDRSYKRAPSGFFGMRGKKDFETDEYVKRAPSGFFGMRGKKEFDPFEDYYNEKRAMGFVGMRGKKDEDSPYVGDKRAPSGFFGMRGKKQLRQSGFFGMRGKKYPYEIRGKFVGVRGKKMSNPAEQGFYYNEDLDLDKLRNELDINQLMLLLTEQEKGEEENNIQEDNHVSQQ